MKKDALEIAYECGWIGKIPVLKSRNIKKYGTLTCELCHKRMSKCTIDHIIPRCKGGGHKLWNLRLTHRKCNCKRSDRVSIKDIIRLFI